MRWEVINLPLLLGGAAVTITGGSDLNNYTNEGIYIYESGATPLHCPTAYAFRMEVLKINSVRKVQIIIDAQNKKWCRRGVSGDFSAYSWERVYDESILTESAVLSPLASALGEAGWKSVSCAKNTSATLATIEQGATASSRRSFIFALKYDNENRIGLYAYKGEANEVVSIFDANRVVIVSTPSSATNYEIYIDGETIKITNISAGTMTYLIKVI